MGTHHHHFGNNEAGLADGLARMNAAAATSPRKSSGQRKAEFQFDAARQKVARLEAAIADFTRMARFLEREIEIEQVRTRNYDPAHFAYSTSAKAMLLRRDNLSRTIAEFSQQLASAQRFLAEPNEAA